MPADGGIRFGQYVLQRRIARGGMAEVFLAQHRDASGVERRVAVKRILPHHADAPDFIQMFLGEAKFATQLGHPNIVPIYDFGKVDADYFIAMEYVDGVHAGDVIRRGPGERMPPHLIARVGADAAAALHYVHELRGPGGKPYGLVHRDVSPANLMLSFDGVVKLCDFGIAKAVALGDRPLTKAGLVRGKYAYMSPEQTVGSGLDGRSDVYTLAIVLWELAVGETLVPRGDAVAAMRAIRHGKLTAIREAAPDAPAALADAIAWGLTTAREQRPTAAQLAQALEAFAATAPELATQAALGGWLRARFPREVDELPGETPASTQETPSTFSEPFAARGAISAQTSAQGPAVAGELGGAPRVTPAAATSIDPTSETFATRHVDPAAQPTIIALDGVAAPPPPMEWQQPEGEPIFGRPDAAAGAGTAGTASATAAASAKVTTAQGVAPARAAMPSATGAVSPPGVGPHPSAGGPANLTLPTAAPIFAPANAPRRPVTVPPASTTMMDNADTLMRSGAFRLPVPSGPAVVPTLLDARSDMRGSPMLGTPALPGHGMPGHGMPAHGMPAHGMPGHGMPAHGMPGHGMPGHGMPAHGMPAPAQLPEPRIGRVLAAMGGVALLSFAIVMVARGKPRTQTSTAAVAQGEVTASAANADPRQPGAASTNAGGSVRSTNAGTGSAASAGAASTNARGAVPSTNAGTGSAASGGAPSTSAGPGARGGTAAIGSSNTRATNPTTGAVPSAGAGSANAAAPATSATSAKSTASGAPIGAPAAAPATAGAAPAAAKPTGLAVLDVHTDPAGATVLIRRCRDSQGGKCSVDRAAAETPIGDCPAAPCTFSLPAASYEIAVELDGARERRTVDLMRDVSTSLDIVFTPSPSRRPGQTGKLTVRAARSCKALVDGHAHAVPVVELELRPGPHKLELQCARRPPALRSVTIAAGKTTTLDLAPR